MRFFSTQFLMSKPKSPYRFVEYLESTGSQYINTGVSHLNVFGYEIEYQSRGIVNMNTSNKFDGIFGVNGMGTNADIKIWFNYANTDAIRNNIYCKTPVFQAPAITLDAQYQNKHIVSVKNKNVSFDDMQLGTITSYGTPTRGASIHMFGVNDTSGASRFRSATRIYSLKLYDENDNLMNDFRPCVRIEDNKPGMYDTVTKKFFTNAGSSAYEFKIGE
ncbi:MAG: hypothetical protein IKY67_05790 [Paludibacteraceae bacterium]|nr:hypothetical protein [Paludibacteraceae bacterium]